jgi:hypothetical protein
MQINLRKLLRACGIEEMFYPGKRFVKPCRREGQFKSHAVVLDWRDPGRIRLDVKAGLLGRDLPHEELCRYPVSLQSPTYIAIDVRDEDEEGEGEATGGGSGGGGGRKPMMAEAFEEGVAGRIPEVGEIVEMVVMGTKLAADAFGKALGALTVQIARANVVASEVLAAATDFVTRYTPPAYMEPTGDEQAVYVYDANKNSDIGWSRFAP